MLWLLRRLLVELDVLEAWVVNRMLERSANSEGYITVFLAIVCCLIAVILVVFVESARQVGDREVAQLVADEASLLAVEQLDEQVFLTESRVVLDKSEVVNTVSSLIQDRSRGHDLRLHLVNLEISDRRVDLAIAFEAEQSVSIASGFESVVRSSAELSIESSGSS